MNCAPTPVGLLPVATGESTFTSLDLYFNAHILASLATVSAHAYKRLEVCQVCIWLSSYRLCMMFLLLENFEVL